MAAACSSIIYLERKLLPSAKPEHGTGGGSVG
jgi:hypothetical protein